MVPAQDAEIPVPLCLETAEEGAVRVRSRDGGLFQVIPPGGLDDQQEYFLEAIVRPGVTVKLAGARFQQYIEILAVERDAVSVKHAGSARFIGEFSRGRRIPRGETRDGGKPRAPRDDCVCRLCQRLSPPTRSPCRYRHAC